MEHESLPLSAASTKANKIGDAVEKSMLTCCTMYRQAPLSMGTQVWIQTESFPNPTLPHLSPTKFLSPFSWLNKDWKAPSGLLHKCTLIVKKMEGYLTNTSDNSQYCVCIEYFGNHNVFMMHQVSERLGFVFLHIPIFLHLIVETSTQSSFTNLIMWNSCVFVKALIGQSWFEHGITTLTEM